ncbi:class I SAM-dependent methyltransferase [Orrella sp. JC864]|uniref:class I SAM-dependent methyltransferase n=1 Tax=Orrella sp. JC864 TaxID=3120298 RepID=UPI00300B7A31
MNEPAYLDWTEDGQPQRARWRSESGAAAPRRVVPADDAMPADTAFRLASEGTGLLWRGDFHNARQLLQAIARRIDKRARKPPQGAGAERFNRHRMAQAQRARTLGMLLIELQADYGVALRRAPDLRAACQAAWGPGGQRCVASLRELLGLVGAFEWRRKGVPVPELQAHIHPHYGVFSPLRGEYLRLAAQAPLPAGSAQLAWDIGTGTGVLAALLARRGVASIVATDISERALECARENIGRLGLADRVTLLAADLFPPGRAPLIVCNPPWVPARPTSTVEQAVYDPDSRMLRGFLAGLAARLAPGGEGWLILSDIAEHLGLRTREQLLGWIEAGGLRVAGRLDARPVHGKAQDAADPLHAARAAETTSLWRLAAA